MQAIVSACWADIRKSADPLPAATALPEDGVSNNWQGPDCEANRADMDGADTELRNDDGLGDGYPSFLFFSFCIGEHPD